MWRGQVPNHVPASGAESVLSRECESGSAEPLAGRLQSAIWIPDKIWTLDVISIHQADVRDVSLAFDGPTQPTTGRACATSRCF